MTLNYQLGTEWLKKDAKKAVDYAKAAHQKALELKNSGMAAEASYLVARAYARTRDDRNQDIWLGTATKFAMEANDADLIIKTVDERSRLAEKERNERKALKVVQEAFDYFSKKGGKSISEMQAQYDVQKNQIEREKSQLEREMDRLEAEKKRLEGEIGVVTKDKEHISTERDILKEDKTLLTERQRELESEKQMIVEEVSKSEEKLKTVSAEKTKVLYIAEVRRRLVDSLEARQVIDSINLVQKDLALQNAELAQEQGKYLNYLLGIAALFTVLLSIAFYLRYLNKKKSTNLLSKQNKIIEEERQRSDELLYNIMPVEVAKELKEKGSATAQQFPEATVLFTDFKNFTEIAERLTPAALVNELNECFRAFDHIISQHPEIEKIKTIGDAYLCASGLVKHKTLPTGIVQAALEMQEFLDDHKAEKMRLGLPYFEARIGIHTGPVVAGVVGFKKFAYDIWGDTVNIAARMEQQCEPGQVNISETTYGLVKYNFNCQSRGKIPVKNKGEMEMYYVTGKK
ncbi:MAG: adenylate/guanylate cyclase [Saprospiraceae bacterium]|nr:adenylate/guanylate cyclase [Saprospiraceae bacterium]